MQMYATLSEQTVEYAPSAAGAVQKRVILLGSMGHGKTYFILPRQSLICLLEMSKNISLVSSCRVLCAMYNISRGSAMPTNYESDRRCESLSFPKDIILHLQQSIGQVDKVIIRNISYSRRTGISNCPADGDNALFDHSSILPATLSSWCFVSHAAQSGHRFQCGMREETEKPESWNCRSFRTIQPNVEEHSSGIVFVIYSLLLLGKLYVHLTCAVISEEQYPPDRTLSPLLSI